MTHAEDPHCVKIEIKLTGVEVGAHAERNAIQQWAGRLATRLSESGIGEYDGDEFGGGICKLYMYGKDADALFAAISPLLPDLPAWSGGKVIKRYGSPGARTEIIDLPELYLMRRFVYAAGIRRPNRRRRRVGCAQLLPGLTGREVIKALGKAGFEVKRTKGSHHLLRHKTAAERPSRCTPEKTIGPGLLTKILRDCKLSSDRFRETFVVCRASVSPQHYIGPLLFRCSHRTTGVCRQAAKSALAAALA